MQFNFTGPQTEIEKFIGGHFCINASGKIEPGDEKKFKHFIESTAPPPRTTVYINSPGGDVESAMAIGRIVRESWFSTAIGEYHLDHSKSNDYTIARKRNIGECMSAATLIFVAGRLRYYQSGCEFGVHQFSFKNPTPNHIGLSQILSARIANYVSEMGIKPAFLEISSSAVSHDIRLLTEEELKTLGVVTGGMTDVDWSIQAKGHQLYVRGERDSLYGHHKVMLGYTKGVGFVFWAVIESQGRADELINFGLVEIVLNDEETRIDVSERCLRFENGIYVNVFSKITQEEARLIAHSESFGVQVRFSSDAGIFFGVSAMDTDGFQEQLQVFYKTLEK